MIKKHERQNAMFICKKTRTYCKNNEGHKISEVRKAFELADAIVIGAGSGLSTAAGMTYSGERFKKYFSDFAEKYGISDMYSGWYYPFKTPEEQWAYWSRYAYVNRYNEKPLNLYVELLDLVKNKDYFVITTNVDHQFQIAGFDRKRLFYTQGDFDLLQCSVPCHSKTYSGKELFEQMVQKQENCQIPTELIPKCPICGKVMSCNLRVDNTFAEDEGWHKASLRYDDFLRRHKGLKMLYVELGVGYNTPGIIKYPFWQMVAQNSNAIYVCINKGESFCPKKIEQQSICINNDIDMILHKLKPE